jgi:hypothetical protein
VTGYFARIKSGTGSVALQHERHRRSTESCRANVVMATHGAKGRSLGDA